MKTITIEGNLIQVDDCDADLLLSPVTVWRTGKGGKWAYARVDDQMLHRVVAAREVNINGLEVDHIDGNTFNNCRSNLRAATRRQNALNSKIHNTNTSGVRGVAFDKRNRKWQAYAYLDNKAVWLGRWLSMEDATSARRRWDEGQGVIPFTREVKSA